MSGVVEIGRPSPVELWRAFDAAIGERARLCEKIDADLARMPADPGEAEIEAHETRCFLAYVGLREQDRVIGEIAIDLSRAGLVAEIGAYLAVAYGGRP